MLSVLLSKRIASCFCSHILSKIDRKTCFDLVMPEVFYLTGPLSLTNLSVLLHCFQRSRAVYFQSKRVLLISYRVQTDKSSPCDCDTIMVPA